ncbi:MAG: RNA methyltransferase [Bacteroidales bacterium]|nr:RNA methyltransferase [Bacteroidales bacterium]
MERKKKNILELTRYSVEEFRKLDKIPVSVLLDSVRSLNNVGSVMRTADAFRLAEVICCGITGVPPHPELSKTALGADRSVSWRYAPDALSECRRMQQEGWKILVLEQTAGSVGLAEYAVDADSRLLLVLGNEVEGVDQRIVDIADTVLEIPMLGVKHSLNVAVSGGIALHHLAIPHLYASEEN